MSKSSADHDAEVRSSSVNHDQPSSSSVPTQMDQHSSFSNDVVAPTRPPQDRKRKRLAESDESQIASSTKDSSNVGIHVDIPAPSSSAMAAYRAAQLPSQDLESQMSLNSSFFESSQQQSSESDSAYSTAMKPLPSIPLQAFHPFLDDATGMDLDAIPSNPTPVSHRRPVTHDTSSPVESFSAHSSPAQSIRSEDIPRIGAWVLPPLTAENRVDPPDYGSQHILPQLPHLEPFQSQEPDDQYLHPDPSQIVHPASQPSPTFAQGPRSPNIVPKQSTPTRIEDHALNLKPPSQPIPSLPLQSMNPALPPAAKTSNVVTTASSPEPSPATRSSRRLPASSFSANFQDGADTSSSSSLGWSTLPRREIVELLHQSPHIPSFLKDEIEKFILRAKRASSNSQSSRSRSHSRSPSRASQSQSKSRSHDDSETQEDGFLRTKKVWCMDLLVTSSSLQPTGLAGEVGELVHRLTQSQSASSSQARAVILLLDTSEVTFDVQELEDKLATILRNDRRYGVWYDCEGRRWSNDNVEPSANDPSSPSNRKQRSEAGDAQARILQLQNKLEDLQKELEQVSNQKAAAEKERDEFREQHDFVRTLYDRASAAATTAQSEADQAVKRSDLLDSQLREGLELHKQITEHAVAKWEQEVKTLQAQVNFFTKQAEATDALEIRRKAALWDARQQRESEREQLRQERIAANDAKRRRLLEERGDQAPSDGAGPFAGPRGGEADVDIAHSAMSNMDRDVSPVDEMDELAALAKEAAEAGDQDALEILQGRDDEGGNRRTKRSRRTAATLSSSNASNQPLPQGTRPELTAAQVEAARFATAHALEDSRQDLEDEFAAFQPHRIGGGQSPHASLIDEQTSSIPMTSGGADHAESLTEGMMLDTSVPSQHLVPEDMLDPVSPSFASLGQWSSLPSGQPPFTSQSLIDASNGASYTDESSFQPHTQP